MATPQAIVNLSENLLAAVNTAFTTYSVTLPTDQYITAGEVMIDGCDQVIVQFLQLTPGLPFNPDAFSDIANKPPRTFTALYNVHVTRCAGSSPNPTSASIETPALARLQDTWILGPGMQALLKNNEILCNCQGVEIINVTPGGPEGAMAWTVLNINIQLTGRCIEDLVS